MEGRAFALSIARELSNKKAEDIVVLFVGERTTITDYFIICTGRSSLHIHSLVDDIEEFAFREGRVPLHIEGEGGSRWVLMDYGDVVVHIFSREGREFYSLERLWADARVVLSERTEVKTDERP